MTELPTANASTTTILEKAVASDQGFAHVNFPNKSLLNSPLVVSGATPFSSGNLYMHVLRCGNRMLFSRSTPMVGDDACPADSDVTVWDGNV